MLFRPNSSSGVPIYLQLMEQVKHAIETGAVRAGEQLPGMRKVAEDLVINPNTVAKAYRELEHEGVIELRHGSGAFVSPQYLSSRRAERLRKAQPLVQALVEKLADLQMTTEEMRRVFENEILRRTAEKPVERS